MLHGCRAFLTIFIAAAMIVLSAQPSLPTLISDPVTGGSCLIEPSALDFGILKGREVRNRSVLIETTTTLPIDWRIKGDTPPWLRVSAESGTISEWPLHISATVDSMGLSPGRYSTEILCVIGNRHVTIPLVFTLLEWQRGEEDPLLERIEVFPTEIVRQEGEKALLKAAGIYSDGTERDMTELVTWVSGNSRIVQFLHEGVLAGESVGDTYTFAQSGPVKSPLSIVRIDPADGPLLRLSKQEFEIGRVEEGTKKEVSLTLRNGGKGTLEWYVRNRASWIVLPDDLTVKDMTPATSGEPMTDEGERAAGAGMDAIYPPAALTLPERDSRDISITIDTAGLSAGDYEGRLLFRSNGGDDMVRISMTVVSLERILLSPASISLSVGENRKFRATGIWSDKRRSDLSPAAEGAWMVSDSDAGAFRRAGSTFVARKGGFVEIRKLRGGISSNPAYVEIEEREPLPVLMTTPREISLGNVGPGERARSVFVMENVGTGTLEWWAGSNYTDEAGETAYLTGTIGKSPRYLRVMMDSLLEDNGDEPLIRKSYPVLIRIESGTSRHVYVRELPVGSYRDEIKVVYGGGDRSLFFNYEISAVKTRPDLEVTPAGIDFGSMTPGKEVTRKVKVRNSGRNVLTWNTLLQKNRKTFRKIPLKKGRYLSFRNENSAEGNAYTQPDHLRERVFFSGEWYAREGYPYSTGDGDTMRFTFEGKGVTLFIWKDLEGGKLNAFIDGMSTGELDCGSDKRERVEFTVADDLDEGTHMVTIVGRKGVVELEGVRVEGADLRKDAGEWIRLFPTRGTAANETDYVNVIVDTRNLTPGIYGDNIIFYSDDESEIVEVSLEVKGGISDYVVIYKYISDVSCLLTPRPDAEQGGFTGQGAAFTLFPEGTPGTSPFYRWYNPSKGDYYYAYERDGEKLDREGYLFEGAIGNIATVRLPDTRELFRWYNLDTGLHFYTTDSKGEGYRKKGYRYDGIAGYVK